MVNEAADSTRRRTRHRSPGYPGIGLEEAIERAGALYREDRMNRIAVEVANAHWGYTPGSSYGGVVVSALKKFGLIDDEGSGENRTVRLTERARRIILGSEDRADLIQEAALIPAIHAELADRFQDGMPSHETLRRYLVVERRFNERAVDDFIDQFIGTLEFSGALVADTLSEDDSDKEQESDVPPMLATATPAEAAPTRSSTFQATMEPVAVPGTETLVLPLRRGQKVYLQVPEDLDESGWNRMMAILNAMKPGIVADKEAEEDEQED